MSINVSVTTNNDVLVSVGTAFQAQVPSLIVQAGANVTVTTTSGTFTVIGRDVPVQSVQGRQGNVVITRTDLTAAAAVHQHNTSDIIGITAFGGVGSVAGRTGAVTLSAADVTNLTSVANVVSVNGRTGVVNLGTADLTNFTNVANVVSVNGRTGVVNLGTADLTNFTNVANVVSVNGRTGVVTLNSTLISAASASHTHVAANVTDLTSVANVVSVNGRTGVVTLNSTLVSAASASHSHVASDITNLTSVANVVSVNGRTGVVTLNGADVSAVLSLNSLSGAVNIIPGGGVNLTTAAGQITIGVAGGTNGITISNLTPLAAGVASAGSSSEASRADHVHPDVSLVTAIIFGG